jgi:hypothetical protein
MFQKRGAGSTNSTPTSALSDFRSPTCTTRHGCSFPLPTFSSMSLCPGSTFKARAINAPWAFTTSVRLCSEQPPSRSIGARTMTGRLKITLWLRLLFIQRVDWMRSVLDIFPIIRALHESSGKVRR